MAGKHDEMLIYVLYRTVLAATAGTNLLLSVEKWKCWRQMAPGTTSVMNIPLLGVFWSTQCLCIRRSVASLSQRTYPDTVEWFPQSWNFFLVPWKIRPTVRKEKWESTEPQIAGWQLLVSGHKELWEVLGHPKVDQASRRGQGQMPCKVTGTTESLPPTLFFIIIMAAPSPVGAGLQCYSYPKDQLTIMILCWGAGPYTLCIFTPRHTGLLKPDRLISVLSKWSIQSLS